ncbi:MAG TPA: glycosyltransferase family 2 protein [Burkholderiales bacterium]|nr:glycosyltransferase family 2 protein [Burkholderiales bacterium]
MQLHTQPAARHHRSRCPLISMVTCSFQQGRFLESAILSVLGQHYPRLEYIVIDGGSTDGSAGIIERHRHALAYSVSEPDRGQTDALVKGFARATGDIHGWLCSDDLLLPGALDAVSRFFLDHPRVMAAYGDAMWIDAEGGFVRPKKEMGFNRFVFLHDHNYIPQPSMFWRSSLYEAVGGLDPGFDLAMDADLWERFSWTTRIAHIPRYLSCMRFYPGQKTRARRNEGRQEDGLIRARRVHPLAMRAPFRGLLRLLARLVRVSAKACAGGYTARVPGEHLAWLRQQASGNSAK